ncbi:haloacid dehalogenase-like hydrolase [Tropicimonas sp. IMCC34011]|uniref:haloacid dehalogenase-like hydrolase n=1 Tax=Tropicimonas sp. IMCC34011 TaxID=2248759 RepID=UPI000E274EB0|nr:haloacid dehalogenase-like hydrolase [Tropicimonas sp. IMCC34011]
MTRIVIVDVCGTLYDENTTAGFVRFVAGAGLLRRPRLFRLLERLRRGPARKVVTALGGMIGRDLFRTGYIRCLAGITRSDLEARATAYAEALDAGKKIAVAHERLAHFEADGWRPVMVSNSLDVVIAAIADRKGCDWLASTLDWRGDVCAGILARDLKGRKLAAFEEIFGALPADRLSVMTDNRSDADVMNAASVAVLVAKGHPKPWMRQHVGEQLRH